MTLKVSIWDPLVGAFVDKHNPKLGKYRSYLILGGIPLTDIFYKAGMALGGVVPGLVMAFVGFDQTNEVSQSPFAEQGILWLCLLYTSDIEHAVTNLLAGGERNGESGDEISCRQSVALSVFGSYLSYSH